MNDTNQEKWATALIASILAVGTRGDSEDVEGIITRYSRIIDLLRASGDPALPNLTMVAMALRSETRGKP